jgi:hypothetical protein
VNILCLKLFVNGFIYFTFCYIKKMLLQTKKPNQLGLTCAYMQNLRWIRIPTSARPTWIISYPKIEQIFVQMYIVGNKIYHGSQNIRNSDIKVIFSF